METLYFRTCVFLGLLASAIIIVLPLRRQFADFHEFVRSLRPWQRTFLALLAAIWIAYGSMKTNQVDGVSGGDTNQVEIVGGDGTNAPLPMLMMARSPRQGFGLVLSEVPQPSAGRLPVNAVLATNWWCRGCWEDCRKVEFADGWVFPFGTNHLSSVVVLSQGEVRTGFCNAFEIAALGTKVAQVPFDSCFYHEHTPSNSYRFVWDRAYIGRDTNTPMTASVELFRNGDTCVTTNGVSVCALRAIPFPHVGIGQDDDWVRANFTNAEDILAIGYANWVDAQVGIGLDNGLYKFTASFPVDPPEATQLFVGDLSVCVTEAGEYVFLLEKGEDYEFDIEPFSPDVTFEAVDDISAPRPLLGGGFVFNDWTIDGGNLKFVVPMAEREGRCCWMPLFQVTPPVMSLDVGRRERTFTAELRDCPEDLPVSYLWTSNDFRVSIANPTAQTTDITFCGWLAEFSAAVTATATFGTNSLESTYTFRYVPPTVHLLLEAPPGVFRNGALRHMSASLSSDAGVPLEGTLSLVYTSGGGKINLWTDADKSASVDSSQTWDAATFDGFECYIEGVETSDACDDIEFTLTYNPPDGDPITATVLLTCMEVEAVRVESAVCGTSGNPPPFAGQIPHEFDVTHSPNPDQHAVVFFKDVVNESDFSVNDFTVNIILQVKPAGAPTGTATWFALDPTPDSGSLVSVSNLCCELRNPKVGGVYHIGAMFSGSPTNECNIVLPLAGAGMDTVLAADIGRASTFASNMCAKYSWFERNSYSFGKRCFVEGGNGDYRGRPDSSLTPSVWCYGTISDIDFMGNICTLSGMPVRLGKLSNLLAGYTCEKLGVMLISQWLSQGIGTRTQVFSLGPAWQCGRDIANGEDYGSSIENMVKAEWLLKDEKTIKPWPNPSQAENWQSRPHYNSFNRRVYSPGFIYQIQISQ